MDAVGIVPHDGEIRSGRLQIGKPPDGFLTVDNAVGIGVFGHRPDELYLGILNKRFHQVHVRPLRGHGHGNQLGTKVLGDGEMPVIARSRAENLHFFLPAPGTGAVLQTVGIGPGDNIKHQIQTGHAAHKNIFGLAVQNLRPVPLGAGQTGQFTVIPGVHAVGDALGRIGQRSEQVGNQIQLLPGGLAPRHIQLQTLRLELVVIVQNGGVFPSQIGCAHARIRGHNNHPFR